RSPPSALCLLISALRPLLALPALHEVALHLGHARLAIARSHGAARLGRVGLCREGSRPRGSPLLYILLDVLAREPEAGPDGRGRVLGVHRRPQRGGVHGAAELIEIDDAAPFVA